MKVLVSLDGSDVSESIVPTVKRLLEVGPNVELHLVTVMDPDEAKSQRMGEIGASSPTPGGFSGISRDPLPKMVERKGEAIERIEIEKGDWLRTLQEANFPGATAQYHVDWAEDPAEGIIDRANQLDVDVICMATHGRTGLRSVFTGSVTEKVIRESGRPVLVVSPRH